MHSYIAVMNFLINIRTAGRCELKGIRHYIEYSQASLTTMETSAILLCVILTHGVH